MEKPEIICVFGDSTAWGAWDIEKGGWVSRLWGFVGNRDKDYIEVYNLSISGGTTETILARFENEAGVREADVLIFQTGGNDAAFDGKNYLIDPNRFKENISEIIDRAKKITEKIMFTDLRNCDESKTTPVPWVNLNYTNENMERYAKIMEEVCKEKGVHFLSIDPLEAEDFDDGLHPNSEGHRKIFEQTKDFLSEKGWI